MTITNAQLRRDVAIEHTYQLERGWWPGDKPSDPNPTLDGVTQNTYNHYRDGLGLERRSVRAMTTDERHAIYLSYWADSHSEGLPACVDAIHFAYCFNANPASGIQVLQHVIGATEDGRWGPKTAAAVAVAAANPVLLFYDLAFAQLAEYRRMIASSRLAPNARSWIQRLIVSHETFRKVLFTVPAAPAA